MATRRNWKHFGVLLCQLILLTTAQPPPNQREVRIDAKNQDGKDSGRILLPHERLPLPRVEDDDDTRQVVDPYRSKRVVDPYRSDQAGQANQVVDPYRSQQVVDPYRSQQVVDPYRSGQATDTRQVVDPYRSGQVGQANQVVDPYRSQQVVDPYRSGQPAACAPVVDPYRAQPVVDPYRAQQVVDPYRCDFPPKEPTYGVDDENQSRDGKSLRQCFARGPLLPPGLLPKPKTNKFPTEIDKVDCDEVVGYLLALYRFYDRKCQRLGGDCPESIHYAVNWFSKVSEGLAEKCTATGFVFT